MTQKQILKQVQDDISKDMDMLSSTIIIFSENKPGVLYRIANLLLRRKVNIESLTVSEIKNKDVSRFTIVVKEDFTNVRKIATQLSKIIEVTDVQVHRDETLLAKEIALFKVGIKNEEQLEKLEQIVTQFSCTILERNEQAIVLQKTGSEEDINFLRSVLEPFGIKEFVRSGRIALEKGKGQATSDTNKTLPAASRTAASIGISAIKRIELLAKKEKGVISLAQGTPSFYSAQHIRKAAIDAINDNLVDKYVPGMGILPLREAMITKIKRDNHIHATPDEVIVTHGGIEALMATFMALLNVEDEIIVLTPDYASHLTQILISTHGGKPVCVPFDETKDGWVLNPGRLEQAVTSRTKAILFCNPSNPTGKVFTEQELKEIARIAKKHKLYIITDEMYEYFLYDKRKHVSIGSFKEVADQTISVFGISKSYSMTGWRIGYVVARKHLIDQIMKTHDSILTCPTVVSQYAAMAALNGPQDEVAVYKDAYERRRTLVLDELAKTDKLVYTAPQGAYYAFPRFVTPVKDEEIVLKIMHEAKVALVPGTPFGNGGENHLRISFCYDDESVQEGMKRFVNWVNKNL